MHHIATEPPIVIEPIDQTPIQPDIADWLPWQFPSTIEPSALPAEPAQLPIIEW
jgi:hypothetical protein